jgi:hypothetical protein
MHRIHLFEVDGININRKVQQGPLAFNLRLTIGSIAFLARWQNVRSRFRNRDYQAHTLGSRLFFSNNFFLRSIAVGHEQAQVGHQLHSLLLLQGLHCRAQIYSRSQSRLSAALAEATSYQYDPQRIA